MTTSYTTGAAVAARIGNLSESELTTLTTVVATASRQIDDYCGRSFWLDPSTTTRTLFAASVRCVDLLDQGRAPAREIGSTTGLVVKIDDDGDGTFETTLTVNTDFYLAPLNADGDGRGWSELVLANNYGFPVLANGRPGVQVTARFGWPTVPDVVVEATINQAILLYKSKDSAFGAAALPDGTAVFTPALNKTTKALLAGVRVEPVG